MAKMLVTDSAPARGGAADEIRARRRQATLQPGHADRVLACAVLLGVRGFIVNANQDGGWRFAVAPLPMIPAAYTTVARVRHYRGMDELQQRIALEALAFAFAFGGTALITFGYGFLDAAGLPRISWWWVWPVMAVLWILGGWLARKRWL